MRDLFSSEHNSISKTTPALAFVLDRFIATVLDFLIFSPVVSLLGAGLLRKTKTMLLLNPNSVEAFQVWLLFVVGSAVVTVFLQSLFLYFWQATPGQVFMQIRVVSYPGHKQRLSFSQCLLRSSLWALSFLFFAVPFLEILSHPLRRTLAERASDTLTVTLKRQGDGGPLPVEGHFVGSWMRMFFLALSLFGALAYAKYFLNLDEAAKVAKKESTTERCAYESLKSLYGDARMDAALALFLLNAVSSECLDQEAEALLWNEPAGNKSLAYVAKALASNDESYQKRYFEKACEVKDTEVCTLSQILSKPEQVEKELKVGRGSLLTIRVLSMEASLEQADYVKALQMVGELKSSEVLAQALEKKYVRTMWELRESTRGSRAPASAEIQELIQEFKDRYEVP